MVAPRTKGPHWGVSRLQPVGAPDGGFFLPEYKSEVRSPGPKYHGDMSEEPDEEPEEGESMYPTEAELNAMRPLTLGERIVTRVMGGRPPCANCRK